MELESSSFWSDIKKYEETLVKDPQSYCFAPLSELYRKLGLLDDALNVAKRGCDLHPNYVGGFMALGRAYYEKGMKAESRSALESVVQSTPDNLLAQKILSQLYVEAGEPAAAEIALKTILSLNPGDLESQVLLESLKRASSAHGKQFPEDSDDAIAASVAISSSQQGSSDEEFVLEELDVVEDWAFETDSTEAEPLSIDIGPIPELSVEDAATQALDEYADYNDVEPATAGMVESSDAGIEDGIESVWSGVGEESQFPEDVSEGKDPLTTATLAELYVSQGFLKRALAIYRELLTADPENVDLRQRLVDLELAIDRDESGARVDARENESGSLEASGMADSVDVAAKAASASAAGSESDVRTTLETWLENISRRRQ